MSGDASTLNALVGSILGILVVGLLAFVTVGVTVCEHLRDIAKEIRHGSKNSEDTEGRGY